MGELVVFTSQPTIVGEATRPDEIIAFMEKRWLRRIGGEALGHAGRFRSTAISTKSRSSTPIRRTF
ncbi:MAG: hypothetical protein R3F11_03675 [Verrucomicrobiales bacterium]